MEANIHRPRQADVDEVAKELTDLIRGHVASLGTPEDQISGLLRRKVFTETIHRAARAIASRPSR
jgi:hypothetical protein